MRSIIFLLLTLVAGSTVFAQDDLQQLVDTEKAFAQLAADKDARTAFLSYMTDDAVVFVPEMTSAKANWTAKPKPGYLLSWAPNFADISSNGVLGYTTGNWEFRKAGKGDSPSAFGDFITLWLKQPDGHFKWVADIGVSHNKPERYSTEWTTAKAGATTKDAEIKPTGDFSAEFYQLVAARGLAGAYEKFADKNIRSYREDKMPILGKAETLKMLKADKAEFTFAKRSTIFTAADLSYSLNSYTKTLAGKVVEKGNFLQIWKFYDRKWHIVLDIFKQVQ